MKVLVVTTPIRPLPTRCPPIGSQAIIKYLRKQGIEDVTFYNIDANRPPYGEALDHILKAKPDVLGISSVVSTAYAYTKQLSLDVKKALPDCLVVVGGNLAASASIILKRTGTDICVLGEGERVFHNVVVRAGKTRNPEDFADIKGLIYLDSEGRLVNTGYEEQLEKSEIYDIDWSDLEETSPMEIFLFKPFKEGELTYKRDRVDERVNEPHRRDKTSLILVASKGCVARCTFCHRWDKGIRYIPPDIVMERVKEIVERYNVGFIDFGDENFGTDKRWLREFCEKIKPLDLIWRVGGMRVNCVSPEYIEMMRDAGCDSIHYGMETGSPRMLEVMEKKTKLEDNINAMTWTLDAGIESVVQLVIGMPGETPETIRETIEFCKYAQTLKDWQNPNDLSVNYAQALPGTPLYEYGRLKGIIGAGEDGEEEYLLRISDKDAHDEFTTLNFTDYPSLVCQTWRPLITIEVNYAYVRKYGIDHYRQIVLDDADYFTRVRKDEGYFANPKRLLDRSMTSDTINEQKSPSYEISPDETRFPSLLSLVRSNRLGLAMICYPVLFYRLRHFLLFMVLYKNIAKAGFGYALELITECLGHWLRIDGASRVMGFTHKSLRKFMERDNGETHYGEGAMVSLRKGR